MKDGPDMEGVRRGATILGVAVLVATVSCREVEVTAVDVSTVTVSAPLTRLTVGQNTQFTARVEDQTGRELRRAVSWSSSAPSVASVDQAGMVRGESNGEATITASVDGRSDAVDVMVGDAPVDVVEVDPPLAAMQAGDTIRLRAIARDAGGTELTGRGVNWASSDEDVATVGVNGLVTAVAVGNAVISATIEGIRGESQISVNASIRTVSSVRIDPSSATIAAGDTLRLTASAFASNGAVITGRPVAWTSGSTSVATVSSAGTVNGVAQGTATITGTVDGVAGNATVTVTPPEIASLEVSPHSTTLAIGASLQFEAVIRATNGTEVTGVPLSWSTSDAAIASVSATGVVTGNAVGTARISATAGGVADTATVFVVQQPVARINISPASPSVFVGDSILLDANPVDGSGNPLTNRPVTWSTGDPAIAEAAATGTVTQQAWLRGVAAGQTWVTAESGARRDSVLATVEPRADLLVTKTSPVNQIDAGDTITFTLDVSNEGPSAATSVVLTDTLPANATFVDATGNPSSSGNTLSWPAIASLAPGASRSYTVRVVAPPSGAVTNVAAANSVTAEADPADNRASVTVAVDALADLAVAKTGPSAVDAGGTIDYVVTVRNTGLGAADNVEITDTLPGNATFVSASGSPSNAGGVLAWTVASIAPGDSARYSVQVTAPVQGSVRNAAAAVTSSSEASGSNNHASVSTSVRAANLRIAKSGPAVAAPGASVTYTVQVTNTGPGEAQAVLVTDNLPAGATFVSASGGGTHANGVVTWTLATLAANASSQSYTVEVTAPQTGPMTNVASVQAATADPDNSDNSASVTTAIALADVSVSKSGPSSVNAGGTVSYTLEVKNDGPTAAVATVVSDTLPAGVTFVSASTGGTHSNGVISWNLGTVAGGGGATLDVQVTAPGAAGSLLNVARVSSSTTDPDPSNNRSTVTTTVTALADLGVVKTGPAQTNPGADVTYDIVVTNAGPSNATNVVLTDPVPSGATFKTANRGGMESGGVVTWPAIDLQSGQNRTYTVTFAAPSAAGAFTNTASVTSAVTDPQPANNSSSAQTTVTVADLSVSKSGPGNATAADTVTYTIDVANAGPSAAAGVVVTDTLPGNATFISASGGGTRSGSVVTWNVGSMAPGQQSFSVRVVGPAAGGTMTNAAAAVSSTFDPQPGNNHAMATTTVAPAANLAVTNAASPTQVGAGETITYEIVVSNLGPSDATGVTLTDAIPLTTFIDATPAPVGPPVADVLTWPMFDLPVGGSSTFTVQVAAGVRASSNTASVTAAVADPVASNNTAAASASVATADLDVSITAPSTVALVNPSLTYRVRVVNGGPGPAIDVSLTSPIPSNTTYSSHSGSHSGGQHAGGAVTLQVPSLAPNDSLWLEITVNVSLGALVTGVQMSASVTGATQDINPQNNTASATTTVTLTSPSPEDAVALSASPTPDPAGMVLDGSAATAGTAPPRRRSARLAEPADAAAGGTYPEPDEPGIGEGPADPGQRPGV